MAIEIEGWEYESEAGDGHAQFVLTVNYGSQQVQIPLPGAYIPGDGPREEVEAAIEAIEGLGRALLAYADQARSSLLSP